MQVESESSEKLSQKPINIRAVRTKYDRGEELIIKYFEKYGLVKPIIDCYNNLINKDLNSLLKSIVIEIPCYYMYVVGGTDVRAQEQRKLTIHFSLVRVDRPTINVEKIIQQSDGTYTKSLENTELLFPIVARDRNLSYLGKVVGRIELRDDFGNVVSQYTGTLFKIPIMIGSEKCNTYGLEYKRRTAVGECFNDPGGYFIIEGTEKVVMIQEGLAVSVPRVFLQSVKIKIKSKTGAVEVREKKFPSVSIVEEGPRTSSFISILVYKLKITKSRIDKSHIKIMTYHSTGLFQHYDEPIVIFALIMEIYSIFAELYDPKESMIGEKSAFFIEYEDMRREIIKLITNNTHLKRLMNWIDVSISYAKSSFKNPIAREQRIRKCFGFTDIHSRRDYTNNIKKLISDEIFPSIEMDLPDSFRDENERKIFIANCRNIIDLKMKQVYLMIIRLSECSIKIREYDDRDNYNIKRFTLSSEKLRRLIKEKLNKLSGNIKNQYISEDKRTSTRISPTMFYDRNTFVPLRLENINIQEFLPQIDAITNFIVESFGQENWGSRKENVTEIVNRDSALARFSQLMKCRIHADESGQNTERRMAKGSQWGFICMAETPEGITVGLQKYMCILAAISFKRDKKSLEDYIISQTVNYFGKNDNVIKYLKEKVAGFEHRVNIGINDSFLKRQGYTNYEKIKEYLSQDQEGIICYANFIIKDEREFSIKRILEFITTYGLRPVGFTPNRFIKLTIKDESLKYDSKKEFSINSFNISNYDEIGITDFLIDIEIMDLFVKVFNYEIDLNIITNNIDVEVDKFNYVKLLIDQEPVGFISVPDFNFLLQYQEMNGTWSLDIPVSQEKKEGFTKLIFSGIFIGYCDAKKMEKCVKFLKRTNKDFIDIGCYIDDIDRDIYIYCDATRCIRPLLVVENNELVIEKLNMWNEDFSTLTRNGCIEYLDTKEVQVADISQSIQDFNAVIYRMKELELLIRKTDIYLQILRSGYLTDDFYKEVVQQFNFDNNSNYNLETMKVMVERVLNRYKLQYENAKRNFTNCEIHPSTLLGISANHVPFSQMNPSARNTFQCAMGKQAMTQESMQITRFDTQKKFQTYSSPALCDTITGRFLDFSNLPAGSMVKIHIQDHAGFNPEDSFVINRGSLDMGLWRYTFSRTYKTICLAPSSNASFKEVFKKPNNIKAEHLSKYDNIDSDGVPIVKAFFQAGDVIIGKVRIRIVNGKEVEENISIEVPPFEKGYVSRALLTKNSKSEDMMKVKIEDYRIMREGDKLDPRHSQKGTVSLIERRENLPFEEDGTVPDIIITSHSIPSRMTVALLVEMLASKLTILSGEFFDATTFSEVPVKKLRNLLTNYGFDTSGKVFVTDGRTGVPYISEVYSGHGFYSRLRHLADDKMRAIGIGTLDRLTHQPVSGRQRDGGIRFGEMERDAMIGHGAAYMLNQKLFTNSGANTFVFCNNCLSIPNIPADGTECDVCKSTDLKKSSIPQPFKVLMQYLGSIGIKMGIKFEKFGEGL